MKLLRTVRTHYCKCDIYDAINYKVHDRFDYDDNCRIINVYKYNDDRLVPSIYVKSSDEVKIQTTSYGALSIDEYSKYAENVKIALEVAKQIEALIKQEA